MKKFISAIIIAVVLISAIAFAEETINLQEMSFTQLVALQKRVNAAIMNSDGWQEVEVPVGVYKVGEDIPAGKWTLSNNNKNGLTEVTIGKSAGEYGMKIEFRDRIANETMWNPGDFIVWELTEGTYFQVEYRPVTFTPYAGKLGFK